MAATALPHVTVVMKNKNGILLFAMEGLFSRAVFESLLEQHTRFTGIILPGRSSITQQVVGKNSLNVLDKASIESLARFHHIPLYYVSGKEPEQYEQAMQKSQPDIIIVACFPYLLPAVVFQYPAKGAYNVHPSLLPCYRGPVPLFWQFYLGDPNSGISIHQIDSGFDTGNIVLQQAVHLSDGISGSEATLLLASAAVAQLKVLFTQIDTDQICTMSQDPQINSYYSWPGLDQFTIPTSWKVRRAFNFIHGTMHWKQRYKILLSDREILISEALAFSNGPCRKAEFSPKQQQCLIQFSDGCLLALL
jgi:methionyl-tRNA formyltransferase